MTPEINTIIMIGVGVLIGCLVMSNLSLRARVRHLEDQIATLLRAMGIGANHGYNSGLGGPRRADSEHPPASGASGVGGTSA